MTPLWGASHTWIGGWTLAPNLPGLLVDILPLLLCLPRPDQTHGSRLRLHQVSPADSGEYVCRVLSSSGPLEASVLVSITASTSNSHVPGEDPKMGLERKTREGEQQLSWAKERFCETWRLQASALVAGFCLLSLALPHCPTPEGWVIRFGSFLSHGLENFQVRYQNTWVPVSSPGEIWNCHTKNFASSHCCPR